jgi:uncharacterized membrane protein YGL010W
MMTLKQQMQSYGAYHQDPRNKLTHFFGVPLVTFSLFLALSWFRFYHVPTDVPLTAASIFYLSVCVYYLKLDWSIALIQLPFTLLLLWLADRTAVLPFRISFMVFLATFVAGWAIQLLGHAIEGKRPALADNLLQVFNATLFLTVEVLAVLGFRKDLWEPSAMSHSAPSTNI